MAGERNRSVSIKTNDQQLCPCVRLSVCLLAKNPQDLLHWFEEGGKIENNYYSRVAFPLQRTSYSS